MKTNKLIFWALTFILISCSKIYVHPDYTVEEFNTSKLISKRIVLAISKNVEVLEFKKSFKSKFGTESECAKYFSKIITDSLKKRFPSIQIVKSDSLLSDALDTLQLTEKSLENIRIAPDTTIADYLIGIRLIKIGNSTFSSPGMMVPAPSTPAGGGGMMMSGGSSNEWCEVSYYVEIWDLKTKIKQLSFLAEGSRQVHFFQFEATMMSAINNSIHHFVEYLKTNKIGYID